MNSGLSNLATLKAWLLPASMQAGADYDAAILAIGRGVALQMEQYCNRYFVRTVDDIFETRADVDHLILPRYPVEEISKLELRNLLSDGWIDQGTLSDSVNNWAADSGLVTLPFALSLIRGARIRLTYTGGFWFDTSEAVPDPDSHQTQGAVVDLDENAESLDVVFPVEFDAIPAVTLTLQLPAGGTQILVNPSAITTTGFTALIGFPIPATGYSLSWSAKSSIAAADPGDQPAGSTAVPDDLLLAWRLQCELVWKMHDRLGLAIGEQGAGAGGALPGLSLPGLDSIPQVKAILQSYIRYALT